MEHNRRAYTEESQTIIRRQRATVEKLKKDNELLKNELQMETRSRDIKLSSSSQAYLARLQAEEVAYREKISSEYGCVGCSLTPSVVFFSTYSCHLDSADYDNSRCSSSLRHRSCLRRTLPRVKQECR